MEFHRRTPRPELAGLIDSIWYFEAQLQHSLERVLPGGRMQLLVNLDCDEFRRYSRPRLDSCDRIAGAALCGAHHRSVITDTAQQRHIIGISFKVGGAQPFFHTPARELTNQHVPLDALWGRSGATLRERILDQDGPQARLKCLEDALLSHARGPLATEPAISRALPLLARGVPTSRVAARAGLSSKALARRFSESVGLTPKRVARLQRFQRALPLMASGTEASWAGLATHLGYYDQSHLIRDFREFAGIRPTEYQPRSPGELSHVALSSSL